MIHSLIQRMLGDPNEKEIKKIWPVVKQVRDVAATPAFTSLTREQLPAKTEELKKKIEDGMSLDDILPEAFATVLRACELIEGDTAELGEQSFTWNMRPYDVQILGGAALHRGCIAEMKTGEGKTLVSTFPVYLNALAGKGVHVITVNDYLARRDSRWMGLLYSALGLTVGTVLNGATTEQRREAYAADITYGTNNEFGFDYLRDNMAVSIKRQVQRGLFYAIVDEVDSILIDEARTPLIISQPGDESTTKYTQYARLVTQLQENVHYNRDEKQRTAVLSEEGIRKMEELLGIDNIYTEKGFTEVHHIEQALRAHAIFQRDTDYVVREGQIIIVDEFTGRLMPGRRYGNGLHQAIEAKEAVPVQRESKTLATITFQNYFRLYDKLAGMTGTAKTEEEEFESIYKLRTLVIPTHRPLARIDHSDAIYRTLPAKFQAVAKIAKEKHEKGQPVLIGTTSIEKSEALSALLQQEGVPHEVLNAKNHEREAQIVADAGQKGAITIATNMAGRGTDIKLGDGVADLGGLSIIGTERHESRRIDNQLRGRSGRQGDPGESQFFVSTEDDLMRLFGGDRLKSMMQRLNVPDDVPLQNSVVSRSIEGAQKRVEGHHFDTRRHVLQYDDVMNKHREIIYARRRDILEKIEAAESGEQKELSTLEQAPLHAEILHYIEREVESLAAMHAAGNDSEFWNADEIVETVSAWLPSAGDAISPEQIRKLGTTQEVVGHLAPLLINAYKEKCSHHDVPTVAQAERAVLLRAIDSRWMSHIDDMAHLREQVAFAGFAQKNPVIEYQDQAYRKFEQLLSAIESEVVRTLFAIDIAQFAPRQILLRAQEQLESVSTNESQIEGELNQTGVAPQQGLRTISGSQSTSQAQSGAAFQGISRVPQHSPRQPGPAPANSNRIRADAPSNQAAQPKVGRNDPCPCGSGKKYKKCHGSGE